VRRPPPQFQRAVTIPWFICNFNAPVGAGIDHVELGRLWCRLQPLAVSAMPLDKAPPRSNRFGSPLVLSRVHWVRPDLLPKSNT